MDDVAELAPTPVAEFAAQLSDQVEQAVVISERRGSIAWKAVMGSGARYVVKATTGPHAEGRDKANEIERERDVLLRLMRAGAVDARYFAGASLQYGPRWLAVRWIDGTGMWEGLAAAREADTSAARERLASVTRTLADALAALHAHRFTHADVQPTNIRITPEDHGVLLDYALACGPEEHVGRAPYRGALTHTTAPETAAELLGTSDEVHVQLLPPADVWALGASLFWCWTGERPIDYRNPGAGRTGMLRDIADGGRLRDIAAERPWRWSAFEDVVVACLADGPSDRPAASEVATMVLT
ncbi:protein kinase [Streptomyces sp. NPDC001404]|uniref:protein kinase domain-containing protein n=1 Tax=Streptomyces sp. NPDC001404 TaxID=3364571 RepID=UPI0036CA6B2B